MRGKPGGGRAAKHHAPLLSLELAGREFGGHLARVVDDWQIPVCTLALTVARRNGPRDADRTGLRRAFTDLQRDGLVVLIDIAQSGEKLYLDYLATAAGESTEALRDLTPEFEGMKPPF